MDEPKKKLTKKERILSLLDRSVNKFADSRSKKSLVLEAVAILKTLEEKDNVAV